MREDLLSPIDIWYTDLKKLIREKQNEGCKIIVAGDFKDDIKNKKGKVRKLMKELHLEEAIMSKYGEKEAPNTYSLGKKTIDGIFVSKDIIIERGGYIDETYCPEDHHFLWIDVTKEIILGEGLDAQVSPIRNKVTSKIPSIRKRFNAELYKQIQKHKLKEKTLSTKK